MTSVIIPAFNEEAVIGRTLTSLLASVGDRDVERDVEIVVLQVDLLQSAMSIELDGVVLMPIGDRTPAWPRQVSPFFPAPVAEADVRVTACRTACDFGYDRKPASGSSQSLFR